MQFYLLFTTHLKNFDHSKVLLTIRDQRDQNYQVQWLCMHVAMKGKTVTDSVFCLFELKKSSKILSVISSTTNDQQYLIYLWKCNQLNIEEEPQWNNVLVFTFFSLCRLLLESAFNTTDNLGVEEKYQLFWCES